MQIIQVTSAQHAAQPRANRGTVTSVSEGKKIELNPHFPLIAQSVFNNSGILIIYINYPGHGATNGFVLTRFVKKEQTGT